MTGRVLVIKHGALGDFVMALGPLRAIREHHRDGRIVLLTGSPFVDLAQASGLADEIWVDDRPPLWRLDLLLKLRRELTGGGFARVYDLQTSERTGWYFRLWPRPRPEWSGVVSGCSHPDRNPDRRTVHTIERQREQLRQAGIDKVPPPSLDFAAPELAGFGLPGRYALLVPGGAAHRPGKRWPAERFGELAQALAARGLTPVLLGGPGEAGLAARIRKFCPAALDLTGRTDIVDLAGIARGAALAVGNDTGPMHVAAIAGAPSVVLFSGESDPVRTAPRGVRVQVLRRPALDQLPLAAVLGALESVLPD